MQRTDPQTVEEQARRVPVRDRHDVIVAGGGLGGVAAALAAARAGASTLMIERNAFVGGVATAGMCCSIFNCYYTGGDGRRLATSGIAVEVADALAAGTGYGSKWRAHKGHVIYDIERAKLVLQELLVDAGVHLLLNALVSDAIVRDGRIVGLITETKSGRQAHSADVVVDATGDADVAERAGASVLTKAAGRHSLCFQLGNVDVDAFVGFFREHPDQFPEYMDVDWSLSEALAQYDECGTFLFPHGGGMQMEAFQIAKASGELPDAIGVQDTTDACQMHALSRTRIVHVITGFTHFDGLDAERITNSVVDGRRMAFTVAEVYRNHLPGFAESFVAGTATNLGVRTSRYLAGEPVMTPELTRAGVRHPDSVGRFVGFDHVKKHAAKTAWSSQVCHTDASDLPLRCLLPDRPDGLLMGAGRSVSASDPSLLRVMVHTMVVGQAAGTAAAIASATDRRPRDVNVSRVQAELRRQGAEV